MSAHHVLMTSGRAHSTCHPSVPKNGLPPPRPRPQAGVRGHAAGPRPSRIRELIRQPHQPLTISSPALPCSAEPLMAGGEESLRATTARRFLNRPFWGAAPEAREQPRLTVVHWAG